MNHVLYDKVAHFMPSSCLLHTGHQGIPKVLVHAEVHGVQLNVCAIGSMLVVNQERNTLNRKKSITSILVAPPGSICFCDLHSLLFCFLHSEKEDRTVTPSTSPIQSANICWEEHQGKDSKYSFDFQTG